MPCRLGGKVQARRIPLCQLDLFVVEQPQKGDSMHFRWSLGSAEWRELDSPLQSEAVGRMLTVDQQFKKEIP
jgi:hypothetical protein